jgi:hypothetical protein
LSSSAGLAFTVVRRRVIARPQFWHVGFCAITWDSSFDAFKFPRGEGILDACLIPAGCLRVLHCVVVVAVVDALSVGTIEGAAVGSMRAVRVDVAVRPFWSVAT